MALTADQIKSRREKTAHDKTADKLNKTTYTGTETEYVDPRTATTGLASRIKKKKPELTAGDAAAALAKGRK